MKNSSSSTVYLFDLIVLIELLRLFGVSDIEVGTISGSF